jgi:hypothetical protein
MAGFGEAMGPTMNDLERLLAIAAIRETKARYCRLLDIGDWEGWGQVFTQDVVMDVSDDMKDGLGDPVITGRDTVVAQVRSFVGAAIRTHLVHEPEIVFVDDDHADVIWGMHDRVAFPDGVVSPIEARVVRGFGWYHEKYRRDATGWRMRD